MIWGGDASAGKWLQIQIIISREVWEKEREREVYQCERETWIMHYGDCTETIINQLLADSSQNASSEWQVTIKLHLVAGFIRANTYFSLCVACPLFYWPLLSAPLFRTVHLSQSQFWEAHILTLAKVNKKQMSLEIFFEKGKDPMMRQQKTLRLPSKRKLHLK